ncbi:MAG: DUF1553 domain-containing protein [Verrucomicrobiales bacterium]|nr:DUF1553 domain-containing protein [Verrucomicrobiales bacterium]
MTFFEKNIRPVLIESCYECHSVEAGKSKAGLLLDTREGTLTGGDNGPAVVPGDPEASLLFVAITHAESDLEMPPKKAKLPDTVIDDFRRWIEGGAPDPRDEPRGKLTDAPIDYESGREFWAWQMPQWPDISESKFQSEWARSDIDRLVLSGLEKANLQPSEDAGTEALLRRLYFNLIGLPPTAKELGAFRREVEATSRQEALKKKVDELLASGFYGERWGRHWLDVARFGESSGKESNFTYPEAWRYRDYVIDAFNSDIPFDRFIAEQLAGDLLPADGDAERARLQVATGFLAVGARSLNEMNRDQYEADNVDEQINATTQAFMASTVACARCHDHKFDPFLMKDYYALAGIFSSTKTFIGTKIEPDNVIGGELIHLPDSLGLPVFNRPITPQKVEELKLERVAVLEKQEEDQALAAKAIKEGKDPTEFFSIQMAIGNIWKVGRIDGALAKVDDSGKPHVMCMGVQEAGEVRDEPVYERGDLAQPGDEKIPRGFPEVVVMSGAPQIDGNVSGRLELAEWLAHPEHPLTARVLANRVWRHLFGIGLVRTTDNFGYNGERPTHPELLDYLALRLVEKHEWSVKGLIREIVLSRTFQQASDFREDGFLADPENRLMWRVSKRRLEAEAIRDAMLVAAGDLDVNRPEGSLIGRLGDRNAALLGFAKGVPSDLDGSRHRSVYLPVVRDRLPDVLELFDFAETSLVTGHRETTNVPTQALYLMNSDFVTARAESLAKLVADRERDAAVRTVFERCLSRQPDADELELARSFFEQLDQSDVPKHEGMKLYCQSVLSTAEFRNLD